jgi:DNA polymerase III epsilon subunit family exonuclease
LSRRDGSLVEAAARLLKSGPVHTLELARHVLGLSGHPGAASAAVFSLLGGDERFRVDSEGRWTVNKGAFIGPPMESIPYAVVDVETTGGSVGRGHRITEVAVVEVREGSVVDSFHTLVNPGRPIPSFVSGLTGITDDMVRDAPTFEAIAQPLAERLQGRVFVAHNAPFDWGFVHAQLVDVLGDAPDLDRLCTVRMARHLLPDLPRRNLDALSYHFDVVIEGRHRALGDALATARIFLRLMDIARDRGIRDYGALHRIANRMAGGSRRAHGNEAGEENA